MATPRRPILGTRRYPHPTTQPRVLRDFNTLDDLITHAANDLGATDVIIAGPQTRIFFRREGQYPYEEAKVWRKGGYWHAEGPGARTGVSGLPAGAKPISGQMGRRAAEAPLRAPSPYRIPRERSAHHPIIRSAERLYHVVAINERTGKKEYLTRTPVTHQEATTILRKQCPHKDVRKQLEPV